MPSDKNEKFAARFTETSRKPNRSMNTRCIEDEDTGKFYCHKKVQGRWVPINGVPYKSKEECEEALEAIN